MRHVGQYGLKSKEENISVGKRRRKRMSNDILDIRRAPWKPIKGTTIIGIGHKARHGKDSTANHLVKNYGAVKYSFATGLYTVARALFGMTIKDAPLLQALGTEVGRRNDDNRWIRTLYYQLQDDNPSIAVIPDVRFPNEAQFIKDLGGYLIKVSRFNDDLSLFVAPDRLPTHPSETSLDNYEDWDLRILAKTGELNKIYKEIDVFMNDLKLLEP